MSAATLVESGRRIMALEAEAVARAGQGLGPAFAEAVLLLTACRGRVIVSGLGKSGLIARKIAATLTSTGTPASYLHPVDSQHGDLGIVGRNDVAIVISKSGETEELVGLVAELQRLEVPMIALTGALESTLARSARVVLDAGVAEEACPHDLAPTTSTTVALALGDALAVTVLQEKGFQPEDFAALHPGGRLGRRLLLRIRDVMVPAHGVLRPDARMRDAVVALAQQRGLAIIAEDGLVCGVLTAGDLSRVAEREPEFLPLAVEELMTREPRVASATELASAVVGRMEREGIMAMPVLDDSSRIVGVVHLHDLLRAGAV
ncbi:MAG: KpsF/GutQ family sugar-phosphate isomerase [Gemmatimonadota bacterium]|nr:KpsF/GutQ family sugar-phosphate isomerase [Gemmatimonadota bacterium]